MAETSPPTGDVEPERLIGERIAGRFVVERLIGHGQLSTAFRAHDDRLHRRVTVKLFHPRHLDDVQVVESQLAAARSVARLSHEHVAMVIDRGEHEGMPLIVLEHVRGENLQERIDRFAPLAVGEVVRYGLQIARALAYAHGHGVMHGNLRPANVLLTEERAVKLVDFGGGSYVAQLVGDPFAAPELREVDADAPPEASDDVYALGALLFVALTEQAPIAGLEPGELQLLRPDVTSRLASTIARALAADPADRFLSMRELAAELAAAHQALSPEEANALTGALAGHTRSFAIDDQDEATDELSAQTVVDLAVQRPRPARPRRTRSATRVQPRSGRETRARILAWSMVVAPVVALIIFGVMIAGERGNEQVGASAADRNAPTVEVPITGVVTFDPEGDGTEHAELAANAIDKDPETSWATDGYDTQEFNGNKPGVGLMLQFARKVDVRDIAIDTRLTGWTLQVKAATRPSTTLEGWRNVSRPFPVEGGVRMPVRLEGTKTRYLLLWISRLSLDTEDPAHARARINEVHIYAAR